MDFFKDFSDLEFSSKFKDFPGVSRTVETLNNSLTKSLRLLLQTTYSCTIKECFKREFTMHNMQNSVVELIIITV